MIQSILEKYLFYIVGILLAVIIGGGFLGYKNISKFKQAVDDAKELIFSSDSDYNNTKLPE